MKLLSASRAPSPRRVRIFLAEKGIDLPIEDIDLFTMEHRSDRFTELNPKQRVPVLLLDDGTAISETMAICRYLEALYPEPNLFGENPLEIGLIEMWSRRIEFGLYSATAHVLRHTFPGMAAYEAPQIVEWGEANRPKVLAELAWLNDVLADRTYIAGERYTVADITAMTAVDFIRAIKVVVPDDHVALKRWYESVAARPSASA
ncbi:MAG: glutathione S-transferase family protein [Hyphomicrobiales bacterium]|nr:glutathione S-transferase family protein [Hyphomicrobiales bacterium]